MRHYDSNSRPGGAIASTRYQNQGAMFASCDAGGKNETSLVLVGLGMGKRESTGFENDTGSN